MPALNPPSPFYLPLAPGVSVSLQCPLSRRMSKHPFRLPFEIRRPFPAAVNDELTRSQIRPNGRDFPLSVRASLHTQPSRIGRSSAPVIDLRSVVMYRRGFVYILRWSHAIVTFTHSRRVSDRAIQLNLCLDLRDSSIFASSSWVLQPAICSYMCIGKSLDLPTD